MPLEIRELVIKASLGDNGSPSATSNNESGGKMDASSINEIVDKVLAIIKEKNER